MRFSWSGGEQLLKFHAIEPNDGLSVDKRDRRGREPLVHQVVKSLFVLAHISLDERHAPLVKELLHLAAEQSPRL